MAVLIGSCCFFFSVESLKNPFGKEAKKREDLYFLAAKYLLSKILERTDWINKELKGESNQQVMRRRASLGCRVAGNDAGVWGAEARK